MKSRTIKVDYLARVEGEGGLHIKIKDGAVAEVKLKIFEPPRFFEAFLRGRQFTEAPDITSRICGICPVAYQMSAVHAMEDALGVKVAGPLRDLRRLLYCGEWIESHGLHVFMLHAPDFLGYQDAIRMAQDHPEMVKMGLRLKKIGNEMVTLVGGREIHPINVRVGGFYRVPTKRELAPLAEELKWAREAALKTVRWVAGFPFPEFEPDYEFVALRHEAEYPFNEGRVVSNQGLDIAVQDYERALRRRARPPLQRPALQPEGPGPLFCRSPGPLQPELRPALPPGPGGGPRGRPGPGVPQPLPEHHRAGGGDRSTPWTRP